MSNTGVTHEFQFSQPKEKVPFRTFIYNRKDGTILGRKPLCCLFYGVLAALIVVCMLVLYFTIFYNSSSIENKPGLSFRPLPPKENVEKSLIWYNDTKDENYKPWTESLNEFLSVYKYPGLTPGRGQNIYNCGYNQPPPPGYVCDVNIKSFGPCVQENHYSYHRSQPCVFLTFNKILNWIPEFYNDSSHLPKDMPENLKIYIGEMEEGQKDRMNNVWVSCEGENPADQENIGPVQYFPNRGFPGYFYPYQNTEGYLNPLVAVHFERPNRKIDKVHVFM